MQDLYNTHRVHSVQDSPSLSLGLARLNKSTKLGPGPRTAGQPPPASRVFACLQGARGESPARARTSPGKELCPRCPQAGSNPTSKEQSFLSGSPSLPQDLQAPLVRTVISPPPPAWSSFRAMTHSLVFSEAPGVGWRVQAGPSSPFPLPPPVLATLGCSG